MDAYRKHGTERLGTLTLPDIGPAPTACTRGRRSGEYPVRHFANGRLGVMKKFVLSVIALIACCVCLGRPTLAYAEEPAAETVTAAELAKRVADLEAYVNNGARGDEATSK